VHEADAALARGEVPNPAKGYGPIKLGPLLGFLWFSALHGGLRTPKLQQVATFGDGATLDVPGSPRVILTPGHTPGSAALHVASLGAQPGMGGGGSAPGAAGLPTIRGYPR
jgi:glyoxylase-like metal-dependent hydrolase (beta-lactamase superfamily II)